MQRFVVIIDKSTQCCYNSIRQHNVTVKGIADMSTFSDKIRELRKQKGVSQAVVAEYLGITKQAYSLYETGKREPDFDSLLKLAEYFGTDTDSLLYGSNATAGPDSRLKFALFGDTEIDDDVLDDVKRLAKLHLELRRSKEKDSKK